LCNRQPASASRCFPAARERAGELVTPSRQAEFGECQLHRFAPVFHAEHARDEVQVLGQREVFPERETLRHVAHLTLDGGALAQHVAAQAGAFAAVGRQQPAQQADRGGLAAAVGAEEAKDLALMHLQGQVFHDVLGAEALVDAPHIDDQRRRHGLSSPPGAHPPAGPGAAWGACSGAAAASTRNTSFSRLPRL
jgi:hypothetical protein